MRGCYSSFAGNARKNGKAVRLSEGRSVLRPDHEPLYVLGAQVLLVKAQRPQVPVEVAVCVARGPLGYCPTPLDYQGTIACFPGAGFVLLPTPVSDDGLAAPKHLFALVIGMVGVGGVLGEEGSYCLGVVSAPGVHVGVEPSLHVVVGQDASPSAANSGFGRLSALITSHCLCTPPYPHVPPNILRYQEQRCSPLRLTRPPRSPESSSAHAPPYVRSWIASSGRSVRPLMTANSEDPLHGETPRLKSTSNVYSKRILQPSMAGRGSYEN